MVNDLSIELIQALPGIFYMIDTAGHFLMWNRQLETVLHCSSEEIARSSPLDFFEGKDRSLIEENIRKVFEVGNTEIEAVLVAKNGVRKNYHFTGTRIERNGEYVLIGLGVDISERHLIQKETASLLRRNQILMKTAIDGIHILDIDGNLIEANDAFCNLLGYTQKELVHLHVADWDKRWSREELRQRTRKFIEDNDQATFETTHRRKDDSLIDVEVSCTGVEIEGQQFLFAASRDISERRRIQKDTETLLGRYQTLMNTALDAFRVMDIEGNIVEANDAFCSMLGYTHEEALKLNIADWDVQWPKAELLKRLKDYVGKSGSTFETLQRRKDGTLIDVEVSASHVEIEGRPYFFASSRDITERKQIEQKNKVLIQRQQALMNSALEGIHIMDEQGYVVEANDTYCRMLGYTQAEMTKLHLSDWDVLLTSRDELMGRFNELIKKGSALFESRQRRKDGTVIDVEVSTSGIEIEGKNYLYASSRDISGRKQAEQQIHQLAYYDMLTNLPNRRLLTDRLHQAMAVSTRNGQHGAVLFIDLDHFKTLNDTKGHDIGDLLLVEVARRLSACVRDGDTVSRLGGDEFVVVLETLSTREGEAAQQAEMISEKIRTSLNLPFQLGNLTQRSTPSIGIVLFQGHQQDMESLLKYADTAMYQAKSAGRNVIRFYDAQMQETVEERAGMAEELHLAIEQQQFSLYCQIQVDAQRRPLGAEMLLRWMHPSRGLVMPSHFIPLAEDIGLIVPIGLWVLQTACARLVAWQQNATTRGLTVSVNVSAKQFRQADFVDQVRRVLLESGANPSSLKLELTESTVLENVEDAIAKMREIKHLGVRFSMDDFGTGYSSLQYLKRLPLDQIKIDQSFVRDIITSPNGAAIVLAIIAMSDALDLEVIAEGVETDAQLYFLDKHGCHAYQGYLFSKPVPLEQFETLLR